MKKSVSKLYLYGAIGCIVIVAIVGYLYCFSSFSKSSDTQYVYIDTDDNIDSVYNKVEPIANSFPYQAFKTLTHHFGYAGHIHTGRYAIHPGEGALKVWRHMKNGLQEPVNLTLPYDTTTIACMFIPNTYDIYWNSSVEKLLDRMKKESEKFWNSDRTQKAKALQLTPVEVITIASIVDEETANNAEKPMIAGMYYNRFKLRNAEYPEGMPLQADPTIKFAWKRFDLKRIYNNLLHIKSPYNTYVNPGLPPGPIRIPSVAGIDAVLNLVKHDYLYMCAKEDFSGTHNFARTYQEHLQNAAKYSKALNERGIK